MNTTQIFFDHPPGITPDTSQTSQETRYANRRQQTPTDTKSQPQTPQDTDGCCLSMFGGVFWHLLVSLVSWGVSGGCLGCESDVWEVSEGIWVVFMEIGCARMCFGFSPFAVWSHNTILAQTWKAPLFFTRPYWDLKYQNVHIWGWQKWLGYMISLFLNAHQKDIKNGSCIWTPCDNAV